jgi:ABC-type uncharacterized transport system permease subunit
MVQSTAFTALVGISAAAYCVVAWVASRGHARERQAMFVALVLHALALGAMVSQQPLRFGFAAALSCTAWLAFVVYCLEAWALPQLRAEASLALACGVAVVLPWLFPGAVIRQHPQLGALWPLHWMFAFAAYGMLASAAAHAWWWRRADERARAGAPGDGPALMLIERLMFRFLWVGFVLLCLGIVSGWFVAQQLGGLHFDHKTVFALLSWLAFAALLAARSALGWRGQRAVRLVFMGTALLALSYVGSRFVLELVLGRST